MEGENTEPNDLFHINDFTNNLNELCLKTPKQKKILNAEQKKTVNKVTFEPPPGTFNITFDTSESESDDDAIDDNVNLNPTIDSLQESPEKPLTGKYLMICLFK